jgi:hypothetical protein
MAPASESASRFRRPGFAVVALFGAIMLALNVRMIQRYD